MFRKACLLALISAAFFEATHAKNVLGAHTARSLGNNNSTKNGDKPTKHTKTKESKNVRSKSKFVTLCLGVPTMAVTYGDGGDGFVFDNRYNVYDCDDYTLEPAALPASLPELPSFPLFESDGTPIGALGFTCNFAPTGEAENYEIGLGLCSGLLSLDTKSNKKSSTSTAAFSFWVDGDDIDGLIDLGFYDEPVVMGKGNSTSTDKETKTKITPKLNSLFDIETLYPIVTATNGAWPKPETVKDFSVRITGTVAEPEFLQLVIEYYNRGWNPATLHY